jgi:hypothetical protein
LYRRAGRQAHCAQIIERHLSERKFRIAFESEPRWRHENACIRREAGFACESQDAQRREWEDGTKATLPVKPIRGFAKASITPDAAKATGNTCSMHTATVATQTIPLVKIHAARLRRGRHASLGLRRSSR